MSSYSSSRQRCGTLMLGARGGASTVLPLAQTTSCAVSILPAPSLGGGRATRLAAQRPCSPGPLVSGSQWSTRGAAHSEPAARSPSHQAGGEAWCSCTCPNPTPHAGLVPCLGLCLSHGPRTIKAPSVTEPAALPGKAMEAIWHHFCWSLQTWGRQSSCPSLPLTSLSSLCLSFPCPRNGSNKCPSSEVAVRTR